MKSVIILLSIALCATKKHLAVKRLLRLSTMKQLNLGSVHENRCLTDHQVNNAFRAAFDSFAVKLLKRAANQSHHFVAISPHSVWITLAAIAEGANKYHQKKLFRFLNLPKNNCSREKFYTIAATRTSSKRGVSLSENRALVIDPGVVVNGNWYDSMRKNLLLQIVAAPLSYDQETTMEIIKSFVVAKSHPLNFNGNSILLNSMEYSGLWTNAFADAMVERSPFYSQEGRQIGLVDLMKIKRRVRLGYVASTNSKILELPIGNDEEYKMIFSLAVHNKPNIKRMVASLSNYTMLEVIASLQDTTVPIDVAIPRFSMKSEIDMRSILEDMGVVNLWQDPGATWHVSTPPAFPTSYIQRTSLIVSTDGVKPPTIELASPKYFKEEERYWHEFVADRPFMCALVDAQTYTSLIVAIYSEPTYLI